MRAGSDAAPGMSGDTRARIFEPFVTTRAPAVTATRFAIFAIADVVIAVQQIPRARLNRPAASLLGAVAMVAIGGLPLRDAYAAIDLDAIVFLLGVLLLTGYLELGGFFEWAADHVFRRTRSARAARGARRRERSPVRARHQ